MSGDTVRVVARFDFHDTEQWYFEADDETEHCPADGEFVIEVPAQLWQLREEALATYGRLSAELVHLGGLNPTYCALAAPCSEFVGDEVRGTRGQWERCAACGRHRTYHDLDAEAAVGLLAPSPTLLALAELADTEVRDV